MWRRTYERLQESVFETEVLADQALALRAERLLAQGFDTCRHIRHLISLPMQLNQVVCCNKPLLENIDRFCLVGAGEITYGRFTFSLAGV